LQTQPLRDDNRVTSSLIARGLVKLGYKTKHQPDDEMIPSYRKAGADNFVVVGGQTNPYHMVANMSYRVSISIGKWA
jgi:hypothetical protein